VDQSILLKPPRGLLLRYHDALQEAMRWF